MGLAPYLRAKREESRTLARKLSQGGAVGGVAAPGLFRGGLFQIDDGAHRKRTRMALRRQALQHRPAQSRLLNRVQPEMVAFGSGSRRTARDFTSDL